MESHVTATEAAKRFADILDRVRNRGESFVVEEGGSAICRIVPPEAVARFTGKEFLELIQSLPKSNPEFATDMQSIVDEQEVKVPGSTWD